jgi:hypothetical protein
MSLALFVGVHHPLNTVSDATGMTVTPYLCVSWWVLDYPLETHSEVPDYHD